MRLVWLLRYVFIAVLIGEAVHRLRRETHVVVGRCLTAALLRVIVVNIDDWMRRGNHLRNDIRSIKVVRTSLDRARVS